MTVVFASFSFDAAISVGSVHPGVCHFPLISLEQLAGCCFWAVREKKERKENDLGFAVEPSQENFPKWFF